MLRERRKRQENQSASHPAIVIKTPLKLYKVNIIEIACGHGVTVSDEMASTRFSIKRRFIYGISNVGVGWSRVKKNSNQSSATKASRIFPRENNKASKGSPSIGSQPLFPTLSFSPSAFLDPNKISKAVANFFSFFSFWVSNNLNSLLQKLMRSDFSSFSSHFFLRGKLLRRENWN